MNVDFDDVQILKVIGKGAMGTIYYVLYKGNYYALKKQHFYEKMIEKELDFYNYINTKDDKSGFNILHAYEKKGNKIKYLLEYEGDVNLKTYLKHQNLTRNCFFSFILQFIKIVQTSYNDGYVFGDVHSKNIMIKNTNKQYFEISNKKIPYHGKELVIIDYGAIKHTKFGDTITQSDALFGIKKIIVYCLMSGFDHKITKQEYINGFLTLKTKNKNIYDTIVKKFKNENKNLKKEFSKFENNINFYTNKELKLKFLKYFESKLFHKSKSHHFVYYNLCNNNSFLSCKSTELIIEQKTLDEIVNVFIEKFLCNQK